MQELVLNQPAPDFTLPDLEGRLVRLGQLRGQVVVINFWSAECPWVERADRELQAYSEAWGAQVVVLRVASNANEPEARLREASQARNLALILKDAAAKVADLYAAQTTPHFFVVDAEGFLRYRGACDDVTFRQRAPTRFFVREAVAALLAGRLPVVAETPAYGCTIVREI